MMRKRNCMKKFVAVMMVAALLFTASGAVNSNKEIMLYGDLNIDMENYN